VLAVWLSWSRVERYVAGVHQRSVAQEIRGWGQEYASVTNDASAVAAAELVGYMSRYYVPGPGYHGPVDVEAALERRRAESLQRITDGLRRYTRLDYGTNAQRWAEWAERRKRELGGTTNNEPGGAANRSQPVRSETNSTSAAAGSGR
jgi:hypothetical protein